MKVISPLNPAYDYVVSTTATEAADPWVSGTSYAKGDTVTHPTSDGQPDSVRVWESLVNTNVEEPGTGSDWLDTGPCNRCSMFDQQVSTVTTADTPLVVVIEPGMINSLALIGMVGTQLDVTLRDGAGGAIIYQRTHDLIIDDIYDWYEYFFSPSVQQTEVVMTDIPPYSTAHMTITLSGAEGSTVACGQCVFGTASDLGDAGHGVQLSITDYSRKDTDDYGTTTFVRRAFSARMSIQTMIENTQLRRIQRALAQLRATPAVWIGSEVDEYSPTVIYGYYRDFSIDIAYPTRSYCSLEIEGLA